MSNTKSHNVDDNGPGRNGPRWPTVSDLNRHATGEHRLKNDGPLDDDLSNLEINDEWQELLSLVKSACPLIYLTGRAGTGKSTLIQYIRRKTDQNVAVVAPTGIAALNANGQTIHSFFKFRPGPIDLSDIEEVDNRTLYQRLDLLILDEASMIRADVLDAIDVFLRLNTGRKDEPFGGVRILLVGDLYQLSPVVTKDAERHLFERRYSSPFFFSADCIASLELAYVELQKVYRQSEDHFLTILDSVRDGRPTRELIDSLNEYCYPPSGISGATHLTPTNAAASRINKTALDKCTGDPVPMQGELEDRFLIDEDRLPSPFNLNLCDRARVMFTKNDSLGRWVNGTTGLVHAIEDDCIYVDIDRPDRIVRVPVTRATWDAYEFRYDTKREAVEAEPIGRFRQFPLMPAWAITIHKSQGKTLDSAVIDVGEGIFAPGQLYVALSRCRTLAGVGLARPVRTQNIWCDPRVQRFHQDLHDSMSGGENHAVTSRASHPVSRDIQETARDLTSHAIFLLGENRPAGATEQLIEGLSSSNCNVRRRAVSALGKIGSKSAVAPLWTLLEIETAPQVRQYAILALGKLRDTSVIPLLQAIAANGDEKQYNRNAAETAITKIRGSLQTDRTATNGEINRDGASTLVCELTDLG